jgi:hypothetical protein
MAAGTGVLVAIGDSHLLLTASHVVKPYVGDSTGLLIPVEDNEGVSLAGELNWATDDDRYDIAALRCQPELARRLRSAGFTFLTLADVADVVPPGPRDGGYAIIGFPAEGAEPVAGGGARPVCHYIGCTAYLESTELLGKFHSDVHIALDFGHEMRDAESGEVGRTVHPRGMSGCSVWRTYDRSHTPATWAPEYPRWIGIQSSYYRSGPCVKVVAWPAIRAFLKSRFADLSPALHIAWPHQL